MQGRWCSEDSLVSGPTLIFGGRQPYLLVQNFIAPPGRRNPKVEDEAKSRGNEETKKKNRDHLDLNFGIYALLDE